jgi:pimeloyl-ACP methyl ester carboxylesterase
LLKYLGIAKADFFGESYGGDTAALIAVRYPEVVRRVATYSATFGPAQVALNPETTHFDHPPTADSSYIQFQRESYKRVAPHLEYWPTIFDKVGNIHWKVSQERNWRPSKFRCSSLSEIMILYSWTMQLRVSISSQAPNSQ